MIKRIKSLKGAGLPRKKSLERGKDPYGKEIKNPNDQAPISEENKTPHELRDVEFQPRISDTIAEYKNIINAVDPKFRKIYFQAWIASIPLQTFIDQFIADHKIKEKEKAIKSNNDFEIKMSNRLDRINNTVIWNTMYSDSDQIKKPLEKANGFFEILKTNNQKYKQAVKLVYEQLYNAGLI